MIAIEGCIGAGKTTIAKQLADHIDCTLLLEKFESNPFLDKFYLSPIHYAFETEFTFLLLHYHQLKDILFYHNEKHILSDFYIRKDFLFAKLNLTKKEFLMFKKLFNFVLMQLPEPDLLICLHASDKLILERINERNRNMELSVDTDYFINLNHTYSKFFNEVQLPKIEIDMNEMDFIVEASCIDWLVKEVEKKLHTSRQGGLV